MCLSAAIILIYIVIIVGLYILKALSMLTFLEPVVLWHWLFKEWNNRMVWWFPKLFYRHLASELVIAAIFSLILSCHCLNDSKLASVNQFLNRQLRTLQDSKSHYWGRRKGSTWVRNWTWGKTRERMWRRGKKKKKRERSELAWWNLQWQQHCNNGQHVWRAWCAWKNNVGFICSISFNPHK